jgi:hypothetical protein
MLFSFINHLSHTEFCTRARSVIRVESRDFPPEPPAGDKNLCQRSVVYAVLWHICCRQDGERACTCGVGAPLNTPLGRVCCAVPRVSIRARLSHWPIIELAARTHSH